MAGGNYSGSLAAAYADQWATSNDTYYWPKVYPDDCVDFVNQALYAGNFAFVNVGSQIADSWWSNGVGSASGSWYNAPLLYSFLHADNPGGTYEGSEGYPTNLDNAYTPNSVVTGDVLMYNWSGGWTGNPNHVTMQVGIGYDEKNSAWYGNIVDQHSPGQKHNIWNEYPENSKYQTTTVSFEHIWAANP